MSWVAAAIGGSAVLGGFMSNRASQQQRDAAGRATEAQMQMFNQTRQDLLPWQQAGQLSLRDLMTRMGIRGQGGTPGTPGTQGSGTFLQGIAGGSAGTPGTPDMVGGDPNDPNFGQLTHQFGLEDFKESPAYQFNLQQGKMALDKASAARGKFYAPSTLQDIAKFSQGMASNEYQNAFSNYQTNMGNIWNRLNSLSSGGQNAAAHLGGFGTTVGSEIGNNITGAGNAQAAGTVGMANAATGGVNNYLNYQLLQQALARNQGSTVGGGGGLDLGGV